MSSHPLQPSTSLSLTQAKYILGNSAHGMSDDAIMKVVARVDVLSSIVVAHADGSKIKSSIEKFHTPKHTS